MVSDGLSSGIGAGLWVDAGSGALFCLLGAWLLLVRPRRLASTAFALFCVAYGLYFVLLNLGPGYLGLLPPWMDFVHAGLEIGWAVGICIVATQFPTPLRRADRPVLVACVVAAAAILASVLAALLADPGGTGDPAPGLDGAAAVVYHVLDDAAYVGLSFFLLLTSLRSQGDASRVRAVAAVTVSFMAYYGLLFGNFTAWHTGATAILSNLGYILVCPVVGATWLARAVRRPDARVACVLAAAASFGFPAAGALIPPGIDILDSGLLGASRLVGVAILAYAILRQQLFDLDAKLKITIRRGTLAAAFLGVFLVVEQVVQSTASATWGAIWGGVAAGALLFCLRPLQHLSARLADRAMPQVRDGEPAYLQRRKELLYRDAYAAAWEDGIVTRAEMAFLFRLRDSLELPAATCAAIEADWNKGMAAAGPPGPSSGGRAARRKPGPS